MFPFLFLSLLLLASCQKNAPIVSETATSSAAVSSSSSSSFRLPAYLDTDKHNAYYTRVDGPALQSLDHEPFNIDLATLPAIIRKKTFSLSPLLEQGVLYYAENVPKNPEGNCPLRQPLSFYKTMRKVYTGVQGKGYTLTTDEDGHGEKEYITLGFWPNLLHETHPEDALMDFWGCGQSDIHTVALNSDWMVFAGTCTRDDECVKINEAMKRSN
jgi:hypothetical protein